MRGIHQGKRVFILASGPSIKTQNLRLLRGQLCISVANFFIHPDFHVIQPRYHCVAPLHPPFTDANGVNWFRQIERHMEGATLFLGLSDKHLVDTNRLFPRQDVRFLSFSGIWKGRLNPDFDLTLPLPSPQSVSIMALMVALYLGCQEIYLLGTDHTSFNLDTGQYDYRHFYDGPTANALGREPPPQNLEAEFTSYATLWQQYKVLQRLAGEKGVPIFNATRGGLLDVFPRIEYESLF